MIPIIFVSQSVCRRVRRQNLGIAPIHTPKHTNAHTHRVHPGGLSPTPAATSMKIPRHTVNALKGPYMLTVKRKVAFGTHVYRRHPCRQHGTGPPPRSRHNRLPYVFR